MERIVVGIGVMYLKNGHDKVIFYYKTGEDVEKVRRQVSSKVKKEFRESKNDFRERKDPLFMLLDGNKNRHCSILRTKKRGRDYFAVSWGLRVSSFKEKSSHEKASEILIRKMKLRNFIIPHLEVLIRDGKIIDQREFGKKVKVIQINLIK